MLAWPLRSPLRLGAVALVLVLALVVASRLPGGASSGQAAAEDAAARADAVVVTAPAQPLEPPEPPEPPEDAVDSVQFGVPAGVGAGVGVRVGVGVAAEPAHPGGEDPDAGPVPGEEWVPEEELGDQALATAETGEDEQVVRLGSAAVEAMARPGPDVDPDTWWEEFSSHLTEQGQDDYVGIDPQSVPWAEVGEGLLLPDTGHAHLVRMVQVQTERGPVVAHVSRQGQGWAVSRVSWDWDS